VQDWGGEDAAAWDADHDASADESWASVTSPELEYIHTTLVDAMAGLRDPRS